MMQNRQSRSLWFVLWMAPGAGLAWAAAEGRISPASALWLAAALAGVVVATLALTAHLRRRLHAREWERELDRARSLQRKLLPSLAEFDREPWERPDVAVEFIPMNEVGGDFYDVFPASGGRVAITLGDVSGKGLPAALTMGRVHDAVRSSAWYRTDADHEGFMARTNDLLCGQTSEARFASLFSGYYDPRLGVLRFISAGRCPAMLVRRDVGGSPQVSRLESNAPLLGLFKGTRFLQDEVAFDPGDVLVLCSDGLLEAANADGETFGLNRLYSVLRRHAGEDAGQIRQAVLSELIAFLDGERPEDDLTLVVFGAPRFRTPEARKEVPEQVKAGSHLVPA